MKTPYLSIKQRFLLLITATLLFGLAPAIYAGGLSGLKDSLNKGKINKDSVEDVTSVQPDIAEPSISSAPAKTKRITDANTGKPKFNFVDKKRSERIKRTLKKNSTKN